MKLTLRGTLPLLLLLAACASSKTNETVPSSPVNGGAPPAPPEAPKDDRATAPAPGVPLPTGTGTDGGGSPRRPTSPVSDTSGDTGTIAGPPTKRLEDVKTEKTTATGGSYLVSVRSVAGVVPDEVGKSVNAAASKTDACYAKVLKKKPPTGATLYEVTIDAKGATGGVKLLSDAVKDADLGKCLEASLKGVAWPKPTDKAGGKATIEFAITN